MRSNRMKEVVLREVEEMLNDFIWHLKNVERKEEIDLTSIELKLAYDGKTMLATTPVEEEKE